MNTMRSVKHNVGTYEMRKVTLSCFDDKRHLLNDGVTSYAYGNKNIRKSPKDEIVEVKEGINILVNNEINTEVNTQDKK